MIDNDPTPSTEADPDASPAPVDETWSERGWHANLDELRLAGNLRDRGAGW